MSIDILTTLSVEADACRDMHNTVRAKIYERAAQEIKRLRTVAAAKDDAMTVQAKEIERLRDRVRRITEQRDGATERRC